LVGRGKERVKRQKKGKKERKEKKGKGKKKRKCVRDFPVLNSVKPSFTTIPKITNLRIIAFPILAKMFLSAIYVSGSTPQQIFVE